MPITSAPMPMNPMANMSSITSVDQGQQQQANIAEMVKAVMRQVSEMNGQIDGLAQQFPDSSQHLDTAKQSLMQFVKSIVANSIGPEQQASPMVG